MKKSLFFLVLLLPLTCSELKAQSLYNKLQAAYIYNFAKYISWTKDASVFTIGVYGKSNLLSELEGSLKDKKVHGKSIIVKNIAEIASVEECHILFVPKSKSKDLDNILLKVKSKEILIVTEDDLVMDGAGISFVIVDNKLKFKLNESNLKESNLIPSEGLINLAIVVKN